MNQLVTEFQAKPSEIFYRITPQVLKTFANPSIPFLSFDQFVTIAQWYRDEYFAPDHVKGFSADIGKAYLVWTRFTSSVYHRHVFPDQLRESLCISFEIPHLDYASWFPLAIKIYDGAGLIFEHEQKLVIERNIDGRFVLSSWKKVVELRSFLISQSLS